MVQRYNIFLYQQIFLLFFSKKEQIRQIKCPKNKFFFKTFDLTKYK